MAKITNSKIKLYTFLISLLFFGSCKLKTKTELHMELGLNYLDNVILVNQNLGDSLFISKIGVTKDSKLNKTEFIIKLKKNPSKKYLHTHYIKTEFYTNQKPKKYIINPDLKHHNNHYYLSTPIKIKKKIIDSAKIILYNKDDKQIAYLTVKKIRINNN